MGGWLRFDPAALVGLAFAGLLSALPVRILADRPSERRLLSISVWLVRVSAVLLVAALTWMCVAQGAWSDGAAATMPFATPAGWLLGCATVAVLGMMMFLPDLRPRGASMAVIVLSLALATPSVLGLPVGAALLPEETVWLSALRTLLSMCGAGLLTLVVPFQFDPSPDGGRASAGALRAACGFLVAAGLTSALWTWLTWGTVSLTAPRLLAYGAATLLCIAAVHSQREGRPGLTRAATILALLVFLAAAVGVGALAVWTGASGAYW